MLPEFREFSKLARLSREMIITEKIDGTNAQIYITDDGKEIYAGSRTRWITPKDDNYGFAKWVEEHKEELLKGLGPGRHFGEWWGVGIQRGYGLKEKRFSLFNTHRWCEHNKERKPVNIAGDLQEVLPKCCNLVPELYRGEFNSFDAAIVLDQLKINGSLAAPGFMKPEGVVVFHTAAQVGFKRTIEKDDIPKSKQ